MRHYGLRAERGVLVVAVEGNSPAQRVPDEGDVLLEFEGRPIESMDDLHRFLTEEPLEVCGT